MIPLAGGVVGCCPYIAVRDLAVDGSIKRSVAMVIASPVYGAELPNIAGTCGLGSDPARVSN